VDAPTYFLSKKAYVCFDVRYCVVLDLARDRYLSIPRSDIDDLTPWLSGQNSEPDRSCREMPERAARLAGEFVELGILTKDHRGAKRVQPIDLPSATRVLPMPTPFRLPALLLYTPQFLCSCSLADRRLRRDSLERTVCAFVNLTAHVEDADFDIDRAARLVAIFNKLRLFYPRPYLCLFDSLALLDFLVQHGLSPRWIFGVRSEPFEAHCWLQAHDVVLNDSIERVSSYLPIMST
jgi:hypothetical protein